MNGSWYLGEVRPNGGYVSQKKGSQGFVEDTIRIKMRKTSNGTGGLTSTSQREQEGSPKKSEACTACADPLQCGVVKEGSHVEIRGGVYKIEAFKVVEEEGRWYTYLLCPSHPAKIIAPFEVDARVCPKCGVRKPI